MVRWERGTVIGARGSWRGVARVVVEVDGEEIDALAYPELTGTPRSGETVLLNTNALRRGLGTGGEALVVARPEDLEPPRESSGHMVKARYTPMQTMVTALDDPEGEHYATMSAARSLEGLPVVVADLHSSVPAIVAGVRAVCSAARIAYVHTDAAALPAAYSRSAARLREAGLISSIISAGQSFGGDLESVTVHSALLGARHVVEADVAIVVQGPGNLGTGTGWGFSGIQAADAVHAASVLGGEPVAALRVSGADARDRHAGLSHHSSTTYGRATLAPAAVPVLTPDARGYNAFHLTVREQVDSSIIAEAAGRGVDHSLQEVDSRGLRDALEDLPMRLSTMGRSLAEDFPSFLYAALAGRCAATRLSRS